MASKSKIFFSFFFFNNLFFLESVLVLGSGMCAPALVQYLDDHGFHVILASRTLSAAQKLAEGKKSVEAQEVDVEKENGETILEELVSRVDAVKKF